MSHGELHGRHFPTGRPIRMTWRAGRITSITRSTARKAGDCWIAPPLLDVQVNGFAGVDFQRDDLSLEDLIQAARGLARAGCTRFLFTLITDDWDKLLLKLRRGRELRQESPALQSAIAGWHVEGPFLSAEPGFCGAHNPGLMRDPTLEQIRELRRVTGSDPVLLTMAPERPGAMGAIRLAVSLGMKVSLGHTNAPAKVLEAARVAGATGFTHLGNACPRELDRHDNILWRVLDGPAFSVSLIPDRIHVSPSLFRLLHRVLPAARTLYTTDAMAAAGAPPGRYTLGSLDLEVGTDGVVRQPGRTNFAGSSLEPFEGIQRAAVMLDLPWQRVWPAMSTRAARFMGLRPSSLQIGQPATVCVIESSEGASLRLTNVVVDGVGVR